MSAVPDREAKPLKSLTILLVEDEESLRQLTELILRRAGFQVLTAADGPPAIQILQKAQSRIDLVITDISLPRMNGHELAARLRDLDANVKILFASGSFGEPATMSLGGIEGVNFLQKPFTPTELLAAVNSILS